MAFLPVLTRGRGIAGRPDGSSAPGRMDRWTPGRTPLKHWSTSDRAKTWDATRAAGGIRAGAFGRSRIRSGIAPALTHLGHEPRHAASGFFPRAAFGLPIVFQFKDSRRGDPRGKGGKSLTLAPTDTVDARQRPVRRDRMASPVILRPYFDGTAYRPLALLLPGWEQQVTVSVDLDSDRIGHAWPKDTGEQKKQAALIPPMHDRGADALTAFMHYFKHSRPRTPRTRRPGSGRTLMPRFLLALSLGPVQSLIADARRTRDLWGGSWLLSEAARAAARKLHELHPGCLVFPCPANPDDELQPRDEPRRPGCPARDRARGGAASRRRHATKACAARDRQHREHPACRRGARRRRDGPRSMRRGQACRGVARGGTLRTGAATGWQPAARRGLARTD